jgi:hypothetical protein
MVVHSVVVTGYGMDYQLFSGVTSIRPKPDLFHCSPNEARSIYDLPWVSCQQRMFMLMHKRH